MERISKKENRYVIYEILRNQIGGGTWGYTYGKGYLHDRLDIWNLEENGYKSKYAAEKKARERLASANRYGNVLLKSSVVKYELAWGPNESGCERPIYTKKLNEHVVYEKGEQE